tara:strand:- start:3454 stop:3681 length:228 start_codon:yes stop_codon:yes gene_type:complete
MAKVKKRSMAELRQVKDSVYYAPLSHEKQRTINCIERVTDNLLNIHNDLFGNYKDSNRREVLDLVEELLIALTKK